MTLRIGDVATQEYAGHAFACAVFDAVARVDDKGAFVFKFLQYSYRTLFAAHVDDDVFGDGTGGKLFFGIDAHLAAAFAQLFSGDIEDGGVVADMVR